MESEPPEPPETQPAEPTRDERLVREQEEAAAAEAGEIGGRREPGDERGEATGFEEAERELIEHASHGDPAPDPSLVPGDAEDEEALDAGIEYADADHVESS